MYCGECGIHVVSNAMSGYCTSCLQDMVNNNPLTTQVGGDWYKKLKIQPIDYVMSNDLNYLQGAVVKYITRHKAKGGKEDLLKAIHCTELLIKYEYGDDDEQQK
jgi:hypothetical protein